MVEVSRQLRPDKAFFCLDERIRRQKTDRLITEVPFDNPLGFSTFADIMSRLLPGGNSTFAGKPPLHSALP